MRKQRSKLAVASVASEFKGAQLGDRRLTARLQVIAEACSKAPDLSFPEQMESSAKLEGLYRFVNSVENLSDAILESHATQTRERVGALDAALVIHDTTEFGFKGREGMGQLGQGREGFLMHLALAVAADGSRLPLGTLGAIVWKRERLKGRQTRNAEYHATKESNRWLELVDVTSNSVKKPQNLIHVMDREGDAYDHFARMISDGRRFVVRMNHDRETLESLEGEAKSRITDVAAQAEDLFHVEVTLSPRKRDPRPDGSKTHKPRPGRAASLAVSAAALTLKKPVNMTLERARDCRTLQINVVRVHEPNPPLDQDAIEWLLLTTEPIETKVDVERIVSHYRSRWVVEEFFRALKSGCRYEQRQLESYEALVTALMIFLPIAWRMLLLRSVARTSPAAPATDVVTDDQIDVLRAKVGLPTSPTAADALAAVARLGGHIKQNGQPGWIVLGRGMDRLEQMALGWALAKAQLIRA